MPYDPVLVQPMREELTAVGVRELTTAADVDELLELAIHVVAEKCENLEQRIGGPLRQTGFARLTS